MPEFDDDLVRTAFRRFEVDARPDVPQPDRTGVRAIARRHRTERALVLAVAAVLLLALPVAAFAVMKNDGTAAPYVPGGSESATPTPSVVSPSATPRDDRLTIEQLKNEQITLPAWGAGTERECPVGKVRV